MALYIVSAKQPTNWERQHGKAMPLTRISCRSEAPHFCYHRIGKDPSHTSHHLVGKAEKMQLWLGSYFLMIILNPGKQSTYFWCIRADSVVVVILNKPFRGVLKKQYGSHICTLRMNKIPNIQKLGLQIKFSATALYIDIKIAISHTRQQDKMAWKKLHSTIRNAVMAMAKVLI